MSNPPSQQSELFQGLGLATLALAPLSLGDIAKDEHDPGDVVFVIANGRGDLFNHPL